MDNPQINFFLGHPTPRLLPREEIIVATTELLSPEVRDFDNRNEDRHPLTYGADEGSLWVREAVSDFMNDCFQLSLKKEKCRPEYLNLTAGASYGVMNILEQTTLPHTGYTKQAFIVSPTYFLINETFIDAGFGGKLTAIDELGDGTIDLKTLEERLEFYESMREKEDHSKDLELITYPNVNKKIYKYVIYLIPTYSNPGGQTYSIETRTRLIDLARKYDMLIISDDVYDLLIYDDSFDKMPQPITRFPILDRMTMDDGEGNYGNTVSNASFSKLIAPGLRFGFQETSNRRLAYQLSQGGANVSGGTPSQLNSMIVGTMLKNGSAIRIIKNFRETYKERALTMFHAIKKYLPRDSKYDLQKGGYFSWCTLPDGYDCQEICRIAKEKYSVKLANGSNFEVVGDKRNWGSRSVRLSVSWEEKEAIEEGIKLWGEACKEYEQLHDLFRKQ